MKELLLSFVFALMLGSVINSCQRPPQTESKGPGQVGSPSASPPARLPESSDSSTGQTPVTAAVASTTEATFNRDVLRSSVPVLVDFWATWCGPCRTMSPVIDQLARDYAGKAKFYKVDVDLQPDLAAKYHIAAIPTFIVFNGGRKVSSLTGAVSRENLTSILDHLSEQ